MIHVCKVPRIKANSWRPRVEQGVVGTEGMGKWGVTVNGHRISDWDDEKVLDMGSVHGCTNNVNVLNTTESQT